MPPNFRKMLRLYCILILSFFKHLIFYDSYKSIFKYYITSNYLSFYSILYTKFLACLKIYPLQPVSSRKLMLITQCETWI